MGNPIVDKIMKLKKQKNAIILAHNYQLPEIQEIADFVGDSLDLSRKAVSTEADVIVFCGIYFMAETASILCPDKTVLIPDKDTRCHMVDMVPLDRVLELKSRYPDATVVTYINSSAEVKAESDYCCTSANAIDVIESIDHESRIIFLPDKYLGSYVASRTGRDLILYNGHCQAYVKILEQHILDLKAQHPEAEVMVHPECTPPVTALADCVLSASGMCRHARESTSEEMIVGTEIGLIYRLRKENPKKRFYAASDAAVCHPMKLINLEKVLWALEDMKYDVRVPEKTRARARRSVDRIVGIVNS